MRAGENMFRPVESKVDFPQLEQRILDFWGENNVFEQSIAQRKGGQRFTMYDGPPTTNGDPGLHHILARVFKDIIPRYKTMQGYYVPRRAGWDTHGLPVELEVERELGLSRKSQIEDYGMEKFNQRCRESALHYIGKWEDLSKRIGYFMDYQNPYITFDREYIKSCWWAIEKLWDEGFIYQGYKVAPHCPRCGTSLSSHEVALGYKEAEDPSIYIKFKVAAQDNTYFLVWTTTPWTLPANVALAVASGEEYSLVEIPSGERLILASKCISDCLQDEYRVLSQMKGEELLGLMYLPLYDPQKSGMEVFKLGAQGIASASLPSEVSYPVIPGDFVSMDEGSGIVHIAPAFGEVDFDVGKEEGLLFLQPVDLQGVMWGNFSFSGRFVKDADPIIIRDLTEQNLIYRETKVKHTYPFCWRCDTPLLYYAKKTWYVRTTQVKEKLIQCNEEIDWYPPSIKEGRFGDWLRGNVDWALSRERYWGTPLPIWKCECCGEYKCIGSVEDLAGGVGELSKLADLHRPYIDEVLLSCPRCGEKMHRIPDVVDAWFDSGAMFIAQWGYPFESREEFEQSFPADFICEGVDQTRGWFYTLHALSVLLFNKPCFRNVISLGHVVDTQGEKMSKAKGNVVDPWKIIQSYGADALRWYLITSSPPGNTRRFSEEELAQVIRRFFLTLWHTYSFFVTYANIDEIDPTKVDPPSLSQLDRWIISEENLMIGEVRELLDSFNPTDAARRMGEFTDILSNWYVRRSRRRFWKSESDADKKAAYFTLYQVLVSLCKVLAPFIPFISEELYQNLVLSLSPHAPGSVHLCDFPHPDNQMIDSELCTHVRLSMKVVSLGRAARSEAGIKVRQPLEEAVVKISLQEGKGLVDLSSSITEELNVKQLRLIQSETEIDSGDYSLAGDDKCLVGVKKIIPSDLRLEGMAREIVHRLQIMRRKAGFDIQDRIVTYYRTDGLLKQVVHRFSSYISQETLSQKIIEKTSSLDEGYSEKHRIEGEDIVLGVKKVVTALLEGDGGKK
jgi:isoleucyl-tRNA synthetase